MILPNRRLTSLLLPCASLAGQPSGGCPVGYVCPVHFQLMVGLSGQGSREAVYPEVLGRVSPREAGPAAWHQQTGCSKAGGPSGTAASGTARHLGS